MHQMTDQVVDHVLRHLGSLREQKACLFASRSQLESLLREPAPETGRDLANVLADVDTKIGAHACRINHPRFLAFIPAAPTFVSILGDWLTAGYNFFAGVWLEAAGPAMVEILVLDWFREFLGLPDGTAGLLTSGGSEANLTALVVARERLRPEERSRAVLYVGQQRHWSVDRAARIIGLLPEQIHVVGTGGYQLQASSLARAVARDRTAGRIPWVVFACAGATNTGAVDPFDDLADLCDRERLWLHADAAYGWAAALLPEGKALLRGIERVDSITLDPHKWLAQPYEVGGLLVRDGALLRQAFAMRPEYMADVEPGEDEVNFADHGLTLTRRFRALKVWLSFQVLGVGWFRDLVRHSLTLTTYAEMLLRTSGFEIISSTQLSIVCFRHVRPGLGEDNQDRHNRRLVDAVRASGEAFLSSTRIGGRLALRFCFVNWQTTAADIDAVVALLTRFVQQEQAGEMEPTD
jgi:glutamate/tyrosine decarboxylase-like PLP-dependent enzyme